MMKNVMKAWMKLSVKLFAIILGIELAVWANNDGLIRPFLDWFINDLVGGSYRRFYSTMPMADLEYMLEDVGYSLLFAAEIMIVKFVWNKGKEIFNKVKAKIKEMIIEEEEVVEVE